jgi:hypothetical protein
MIIAVSRPIIEATRMTIICNHISLSSYKYPSSLIITLTLIMVGFNFIAPFNNAFYHNYS